MLGYVNLFYEDKDYTRKMGEQVVAEELSYLNQYLQSTLRVQEKDYLFTETFDDKGWRSSIDIVKNKRFLINQLKYDWLKDNPFERLRQSTIPGSNQFLNNERTFIKAVAESNSSLYWQYIENLFWFQNIPKNSFRDRFVNIIMTGIVTFQNDLLRTIGQLTFGLDRTRHSKEITEDDSLLGRISAELGYQHNMKFPIGKYKAKIRHPFLRFIVDKYLTVKLKQYWSIWEKHFAALILELQEYRNADLHSGRVNIYSKIKMDDLIPLVMNRARWTITEAWEKNNKLHFNELINQLAL